MDFLSSLFKKQLVGLDIGVSGVKAVELVGRREAPRLGAYNRVPLPWGAIGPDGELADQEVLVAALKKLFAGSNFSTKRVAIGAGGNSIITKKISVPSMSEAELREQLYWEAEQYVPFNINEVNLDFAVLGSNGGTSAGVMDVLLVAAKRDYIQALSGIVKDAGLEPAVVDLQAFALGNAFEFNYGDAEEAPGTVQVLIDFGAGSTKMSMVEGDRTTFTRELRQSGVACTQQLAERLGVPVEEAERLKILEPESDAVAPILNEFVESAADEVARTVDFAVSQTPDSSVRGIFVCGGGSRTFGLLEALERRIPVPVEPLNPVRNIAGSGKKMNPQALRELGVLGAVAVGLALRTEGDAK